MLKKGTQKHSRGLSCKARTSELLAASVHGTAAPITRTSQLIRLICNSLALVTAASMVVGGGGELRYSTGTDVYLACA